MLLSKSDVSLTNKRVREALENLITELKDQDGERFSLDSALFRSQKRGHFSANTVAVLDWLVDLPSFPITPQ